MAKWIQGTCQPNGCGSPMGIVSDKPSDRVCAFRIACAGGYANGPSPSF